MNYQNNDLIADRANPFSIRDLTSRYLGKWPLLVIVLILCLGSGMLIVFTTPPKYIATTSLLIKGSDSESPNSNDIIEQALNGKRELNINNAMLLMGSARLMNKTVRKNSLNVSYFKRKGLLRLDVFQDAPFLVTVRNVIDSSSICNIDFGRLDSVGGTYSIGGKEGMDFQFRWGEAIIVCGKSFILVPKIPITDSINNYSIRWQPVEVESSELLQDLIIKPFDSKTSVLQLSLTTSNLSRGCRVLNALIEEFVLADIEDRRKLSETTVKFIDERLLSISSELKGVEGTLEDFQGANQLVDIKGQSTQSLENANVVSKSLKEIAIQSGIVTMIQNYFSDPNGNNKLVPSSFGLNDGTLASLIAQYNELQLKKERELPSVAAKSTVMQDLNIQLANLRSSIIESLSNISKTLEMQQANLKQQDSQYSNYLSSIPHNERVLQEIKRKHNITEGLYLYLLQRREEASISGTAFDVANYSQIDLATGYGPIAPNVRNIIIFSIVVAIAIIIAWVWIADIFNSKISSKEDVIKRTSLPLLGEISHIAKRKKETISVLSESISGEEFRLVRTNLALFLKDASQKVILVTSSMANEGKSFVSLNTSAVFAITGKKVALLEFDLRKPVISNNLGLDSSRGLTDFLNGKISNLSEISQPIASIPSLDVYPTGVIHSNPADILLSEYLPKLFSILQQTYDYVIVDSPPLSLVSDALILANYCDIVAYVVRQGVTNKATVDGIDGVVRQKNIRNVSIIFNDGKGALISGYYSYARNSKAL